MPCNVCKRHISQAFYEQFLSPSCPPIGAAWMVLESVHEYTGLPWWASLAVTTVTLRSMLTFPLMVYSRNNTSKLEQLKPELESVSKELMAEVVAAKKQYEWSDRVASFYFVQNVSNCHVVTVVNLLCLMSVTGHRHWWKVVTSIFTWHACRFIIYASFNYGFMHHLRYVCGVYTVINLSLT